MLQKLRNLTNTIFVKLIIGLLILSFALWGIGDMFRGKITNHVAKIGNFSVSPAYLEYRTKLLQDRYRQYFNSENDIDSSVIQNLALNTIIREKIIDFETQELGYIVDNKLAFSLIRENQNFLDVKGDFSQVKFKNYLIQQNITEANLFDNLSKEISSNIFNSGFSNTSIDFPKLYELESNFVNEERIVSLIKINIPKTIPDIKNPMESELLDFYSKYKEDYILPETRDVEILHFSCAEFANKVEISDDKAKLEYKKNLDKYQVLEQRKVQQLYSESEEQIKKAHLDLSQGKGFTDVAKTLNMSEKDINLGFLDKKKLYSNFVAPVFNADMNEYSSPVKGPFGWHIFKVTEIKAGKKISFINAKQQVIDALQEQESCSLAVKSFNNAEDNVSANLPFKDIAQNYGLPIKSYDKVQLQSGINSSELSDEQREKLVQLIFSSKATNIINSEVLGENHFILYNVKQIYEKRYLTIDEIKGVLSTRWKKEKHQEKYKSIADTIYTALKDEDDKHQKLRKLKRQYKFSFANTNISRDNDSFPEGFINNIFSLSDNDISEAFYNEAHGQYLLAILDKVQIKETSPGQKMLLNENIKNNYLKYFNSNINSTYLNYLINKHNVVLRSNNTQTN